MQEVGMSTFKNIINQGIHYTNTGIRDYETWSQMFLDTFGPAIKPNIKYIRMWSLLIPDMINYGRQSKLNCWEFMGCGLHANSDHLCIDEGACCPVSFAKQLNGLHGGQKAGRSCWLVLRTLCRGTRQETLRQKQEICSSCDFYSLVADEEDGKELKLFF